MAAADTATGVARQVRALQRRLAQEPDLPRRMLFAAAALVDRPYVANSLIGAPDRPERLVVNLEAFDCLTFIESVLALARSRSWTGFIEELKQARYREGRVEWSRRLHYFHDWLICNQRRGAICIRTRGAGSHSIAARLGFIPEIPQRQVRFHVVPRPKIHLARRRITDGSIVAFASVRANLDFFHTGLLFWREELWLYHAARSLKKVVAEPLSDFLDRNRTRGIVFAAPRNPGGRR